VNRSLDGEGDEADENTVRVDLTMQNTMRVIAVDWSGALSGAERKIWLAEAADGNVVRLENGRNRIEIADYLIYEAQKTPEMVIGLDFAFSLPAWFLVQRGLTTAQQLWALADVEAETWLQQCSPPFWGRPGKKCPQGQLDSYHFRWTDRAVGPVAGNRPKSVFQIGGAGAVGTGSLRGMSILHRLHSAGFCIWPFDPPGWPKVVEIYPRLLTGPVIKSAQNQRDAYLRCKYPGLAPWALDRSVFSEDAFDAAVSALVMWSSLAQLESLSNPANPLVQKEGIIWQPGAPTLQVFDN